MEWAVVGVHHVLSPGLVVQSWVCPALKVSLLKCLMVSAGARFGFNTSCALADGC